ncbi:MAG: Holliday junction resolvase RuvX [Candidatus Omnitrophota bacterium]
MALARILGLDVGSKRIGVAVSDPLGITAQGVCVINRKESNSDMDQIRRIIDEYTAEVVVVGLPLNMNGTRGKSVEIVDEFIKALGARIDISIKTYDERLTTMESEKFLISSDVSRKKRKEVVDMLAAQLMLQSYLGATKTFK